MRRERLELVWRRLEGQPRLVGDTARDLDVIPLDGVEAGPDRGAAQRQLAEVGQDGLRASDAVLDLEQPRAACRSPRPPHRATAALGLLRVAAELLAERERRRVLACSSAAAVRVECGMVAAWLDCSGDCIGECGGDGWLLSICYQVTVWVTSLFTSVWG